MMVDRRPVPAIRITLQGDLDMEGAEELRALLPQVLDLGLPLRLHLDLTHVTFLDCSGARALTWLDDRLRGRGGSLAIVRASRPALRLLRLLGLDRTLLVGRPGHPAAEDLRVLSLRSLRTREPDRDPSVN
ncbi:hypothetical protein Sru01_24060 [Sphaerisporangium rufum]|uniref:STAS domain-containing protein n=2 Tax=Sphaerisporangium rufum TaxID=1381558 RepID=A0A919R0A5_9ACTN|nr:hypothetical protein Sru01_24060 [Sphaerisporangium rufum]